MFDLPKLASPSSLGLSSPLTSDVLSPICRSLSPTLSTFWVNTTVPSRTSDLFASSTTLTPVDPTWVSSPLCSRLPRTPTWKPRPTPRSSSVFFLRRTPQSTRLSRLVLVSGKTFSLSYLLADFFAAEQLFKVRLPAAYNSRILLLTFGSILACRHSMSPVLEDQVRPWYRAILW